MKKISLLLTVVFLFLGISSANAVPFSWDLSKTDFMAHIGISNVTNVVYPTDITTSGASTITQSLTGGANNTILDNGDTFTELGGLTVISAGNFFGFPTETNVSFLYNNGVDAASEAFAYIYFTGLSGYVTNHNNGGTPTTGAATIIDDTFNLVFNPGIGTIKFYLDTDYNPNNSGTTLEIASLKLLSGTGTSPIVIQGVPEGQFGLTAGFESVLDDFWYLNGAPAVDFNDWMTQYDFPSIFATSFNLGATATIINDLGGNIVLGVLNEGSFIISTVPEPTTLVLFGIGLLGLAGVTRRKVS